MNHNKKKGIRYQSPSKLSKSNSHTNQHQQFQPFNLQKHHKLNTVPSSYKILHPTNKRLIKLTTNPQDKNQHKKSLRVPSKKKKSLSEQKIKINKLENEKPFTKLRSKHKARFKEESTRGRNTVKQLQKQNVAFKKIYMPSDEYYGEKQEFICAANTEQTLNESSREFLIRYKKLVNRIKSLELLHKRQYEDLREDLQEHELMRLVKIQSLERVKVEHRLVRFIQKN